MACAMLLRPSRQLSSALGSSFRRTNRLCSRQNFATLSLTNLPKNVLECEFAVCGAVAKRGEELAVELSNGAALDFDEVVPCHLGSPQALGQDAGLFHRQVLACLAEPSLLQKKDLFPEDVHTRASHYLAAVKGGHLSAYSTPKGHAVFREDVAAFFTERDGLETDVEDLFLTDGLAAAVRMVLQLAVEGRQDGVLLPIPQYPLYTAATSFAGGQSVGYFLDEKAGWTIQMDELETAVSKFRASGGTPRAIVVINPGNPTGHVLSREVMEGVLKFAEQEGLMVLADEVHQDCIHQDEREWMSFRKLARELGTTVEVFSFHSASQGIPGEGGIGGGVVHCENVAAEVKDEMRKLASIGVCSNTFGQALLASVLRPPMPGSPQHGQIEAARATLKRRAQLVADRLNAIEGMECQPIEGATYAFPKLVIKGYIMKKAISFATPADQVYCMELVERTGVVTVPGSGFGQRPGHFHFMMSLLHDEATLNKVLDRIERFHTEHQHGWFR